MDFDQMFNVTQSASYLGVSRTNFYHLIKRYDLKPAGTIGNMDLFDIEDLRNVKEKLTAKPEKSLFQPRLPDKKEHQAPLQQPLLMADYKPKEKESKPEHQEIPEIVPPRINKQKKGNENDTLKEGSPVMKTKLHPDVLHVNIPYTPEQQKRLKHFCKIIGCTMNDFAASALENEFKARVAAMDEPTQATIRKLLAQAASDFNRT